MAYLDKTALLQGKALKVTEAEIDGLGTVKLRELSASQMQEITREFRKAKEEQADSDFVRITTKAFVQTALNEDGEILMFSDQDIDLLINNLPATAINSLSSAIMKLSGVVGKDNGDAQEEIVKNSDTQSTDSVSV